MSFFTEGRVRAALRAAFTSRVLVYPATRSTAIVVLPSSGRTSRP